MSNICDFDRILKTECNTQHFNRNCRIKNLDDFERDEADAYLSRARPLDVKEKWMTICYIMKRCLGMFLRGGKVNAVQYWWNIVAKLKVNKWSLSKWFNDEKPKNINVVPGQLFCCQYKAKFLLATDSLYDQDKFESVTDTDNGFTECQAQRK